MAPVENRNVRSMFLTSCLAVIFGVKLLDFFSNHIVCLMMDCVVRLINKRIEMSCRAIQKISASLLSFTRNTDNINIRAFIRLVHICGFAGMNNHDVALL